LKKLENLSPKQYKTFLEANHRINVWVGAVRSGKSFVSLMRFLQYIRTGPHGDLMIVGKSQDTIKRNILSELQFLMGSDMRVYEGKREMHLWGRTIHLVGASDERASQKIQGATLAGAYVDELTLIPESFWIMLLSRLSVPGAKVFATTNPDSPFHWAKRNLLEREGEIDLKSWQFFLDDNPSLDEAYKTNLKREYRGLWYQRYIEGKWVLAEGTIYDFFDPKLHCIDFPPSHNPKFYLVGVDYGTSNPCAFSLVGYNDDHFPNMWVEKEYYYDSAKHMRQKTDTEYAQDLERFVDNLRAPVKAIYMDPSAVSFRLECRRHGIRNIIEGNNDVLDGIRFVSSLLSNGTLKVCANCKNMIQEFGSYTWNTAAKERGEDKPNKHSDHCFIAGTPVSTDRGKFPIEVIKVGDKIITPIGTKKVLKTFKHEVNNLLKLNIFGREITCTPNHNFFTLHGWKQALELNNSDIFLLNLKCPNQNSLYLKESSIEGIYPPKMPLIENTLERIKRIALEDMDISIEMFGNSTMGTYPKDTIFITSTEIPQTMILATSNLWKLLNTYPILAKILQKNKNKLEKNISIGLDLLQKNGISHRKDLSGIENTQEKHLPGLKASPILKHANNVVNNSNLKPNGESFVRITVKAPTDEQISLILSLEFAQYVVRNLTATNIATKSAVQSLVIKNIAEKNEVYNLTIEDMHVFYVDDILVLNCLDNLRYALFSHFGKYLGSENRMGKEDLMLLRRRHGY